jgi:hypothetical protein
MERFDGANLRFVWPPNQIKKKRFLWIKKSDEEKFGTPPLWK